MADDKRESLERRIELKEQDLFDSIEAYKQLEAFSDQRHAQ